MAKKLLLLVMGLSLLAGGLMMTTSPAYAWTCISLNKTAQEGLAVTVSYSYSSSATEAVKLEWGDGNVETLPSTNSGSGSKSHTYAAAGGYTIILKVFNEAGTQSSNCTKNVTLTATSTPTSTATFTLTATNTSTETPTGTFTATLTQTATNTETASPTFTMTPSNTPEDTATFTLTPVDTATNTATVTMTLTSVDPSVTPDDTPTYTATVTGTLPAPSVTVIYTEAASSTPSPVPPEPCSEFVNNEYRFRIHGLEQRGDQLVDLPDLNVSALSNGSSVFDATTKRDEAPGDWILADHPGWTGVKVLPVGQFVTSLTATPADWWDNTGFTVVDFGHYEDRGDGKLVRVQGVGPDPHNCDWRLYYVVVTFEKSPQPTAVTVSTPPYTGGGQEVASTPEQIARGRIGLLVAMLGLAMSLIAAGLIVIGLNTKSS